MESILLIGLCVFAASSLYFGFFYKAKDKFNTSFLVSATTAASYLLMSSGLLWFENSNGDVVLWTRWIGYALSCSLLMYVITKKLSFSKELVSNTIALNILVMITGALAAVLDNWYMIGMFVISSVAYIMMIKPILTSEKTTNTLNMFILGGWSMFPVVFLLSSEGFSLIDNTIAFSLYLLLDIFTKIYFYFEQEGK